jgi:aminoglycoside phosphotransferase (APT) family kinase protein
MEPVEGFNAGSEMPELHASTVAVRHEMGLSMAAAVARLGAVDHVAVGLADFGKPTGFLERQVPRWLSELESYAKFDNYPGPDIGDVGGVAAWLREHQPADFSPGIMHGDYHAANVMFSRSGPELVAIVDWEMCTIGDPLLDLGWMLVCWPVDPNPLGSADYLAELGGLAARGELLAAYEAAGGRRTEDLDWYLALACLKLGVVIEGTWVRYLAGRASREAGERLHESAVTLMGLGSAVAAVVFIGLYSFGTGLFAVSRATLPLWVFGSAAYGTFAGRIAFGQNVANAIAPVVLAYVLDRHGLAPAVWLLAATMAAAFVLLLVLGSVVRRHSVVATAAATSPETGA